MEYVDMPDPLGGALKELFGLPYFFPYQRLVIANILEVAAAKGIKIRWPQSCGLLLDVAADGAGGREARAGGGDDRAGLGRQIVILPTGAGKSLCFQLPAMLLDGPTLVIYPILSLMADQERRLAEKGFAPVLLRGGQSAEERRGVWERVRSGECRFVIANPEVLLAEGVKRELKSLGIVHLVIDEAHCVSEWGESFRPGYLRIGEIIEAAGGPLVTAFTATASAPVLEKIEKYVFGAPAFRVVGNPDRGNISYAARGAILKDLAVRDLLARNERPAIVFCSSRKGTENLVRYLRDCLGGGLRSLDGGEIKFYHAGLSREEKTAVEKWFFGSPGGTLVATCAYGMGVDKSDIRTVIHRDCPPSVEAYLQESGRAGRDGKQSRAFLLWGPDDTSLLSKAADDAGRLRLERLLEYAHHAGSCRREFLLKLQDYEAGGTSPEANCCDFCEGAASGDLREEGPVKNYIRRNRRSRTIKETAALIASAETIGCGEQEAETLLRVMLSMKTIKCSRNPLWKNKLTSSN
jgi:ATP-dependent DNA helicase RecQ